MQHPKPETDCPFCDFSENRAISTGKLSQSILSNPRLMPGHALVMPRRHVEDPADLTHEELQEIFEEIGRLEQIMLNTSLATGYDIRQNYRPFLDQSRTKVNHLHFHVLPRTFEDELYRKSMKFEVEIFEDLSTQETEQMKKLLG